MTTTSNDSKPAALADYLVELEIDLIKQFENAVEAKWATRPIRLIRLSVAYKSLDSTRIRQLIRDHVTENNCMVSLAREYPDLYHPNIIRAREVENRVYAQISDWLLTNTAGV